MNKESYLKELESLKNTHSGIEYLEAQKQLLKQYIASFERNQRVMSLDGIHERFEHYTSSCIS